MSESTRLRPGAALGLFFCPPPSTTARDAAQKVAVSSESHSSQRSGVRLPSAPLSSLSRPPAEPLCRRQPPVSLRRATDKPLTKPRAGRPRVRNCPGSKSGHAKKLTPTSGPRTASR
jgi:hypothetical protein